MANQAYSSGRRARAAAKGKARRAGQYYTQTSTVRQPAAAPRRSAEAGTRQVRRGSATPAGSARSAKARPVRAVAAPLSAQAKRNRERALRINRGFLVFLAVIMVAIMGVSIRYIQLRAEYTALITSVARSESELALLKEDNDAYYSQVTSGVDLSRIRRIAIGRLGMKAPDESQREYYTTSEGSGYVRQYQDIPVN